MMINHTTYRRTTVLRKLQPSLSDPNTHVLEESRRYWFARMLGAVLILAAFGPYVAGPIRTEQLAVYGVVLIAVLTLTNLRLWHVRLLAPWLWMTSIATAATLLSYPGRLPWPPGSVLSGFDNLFLPPAIMLITWTLLPRASVHLVLRAVVKTLIWASAVNAVLSIMSSLMPTLMVPLLKPFWSAEEGTVAETAMEMGRFTGVFNQPAEAGVVYSLAAIVAVWAYSHRAALLYPLLTLLTVGGMLSVSKVFLLIGLPTTLMLLWVTRRGVERVWMLGVVILLGVLTLSSTFIQDWAGYDYMMRLLEVPPGESPIQFYTAGRWNEDASMRAVLLAVLSTSPLAGVGAAGLQVPYDSQWTEAMVMSGLLGTLGIAVVFVVLVFWFRRIRSWQLRWTSYAIWIVLFFGSFGISTLTANRVTTTVWVLITLLVAVAARDGAQEQGTGHARARNRQ